MLRSILAIGLLAASCQAAGTFVQSIQQIGGPSGLTFAVAFHWTGDSATGSVPPMVARIGQFAQLQGYYITTVETVPESPAPSGGYGLTIKDQAGVDVLNGAAATVSGTVSQSFAAASSVPPINGTFTVTISNQINVSARGTVYVFLQDPTTVSSVAQSTVQNSPANWLTIANPPFLDTRSFNFTPIMPGGTLTGGTPATVSITCPPGVNGSDVNHYLRLSAGTGAAEAVLLTGGNCASGDSGTIMFTPANSHSGAWTVSSASSGIRECFIAAGPNGACLTPAGTWNFFAPIYDDQNVSWFGTGDTSIIQQQFVGDGIIIGPPTYPGPYGGFTSIHHLKAQYGLGTFATTGSLWTFQNIANGQISDLDSFLGNVGFKFAGVTQANWSNLWSNARLYGLWFICTSGAGCAPSVNAASITNVWATTQAGGSLIRIEPTIGGLFLQNLNVVGGCSQGIDIVFNATGIINELGFTGGSVDSCTSNALLSHYFGASGSSQGSSINISNMRFTTAGSAVTTVANLSTPLLNMQISNSTFYNGGSTGDIFTLSGVKKSVFTGNTFGSAVSSSRIVLQAGSGGETNADNLFSANTVGYLGVPLTSALVTDAAAHSGNRFVGNKFNGPMSWSATGVDNAFDLSNQFTPAIAFATLPNLGSGSSLFCADCNSTCTAGSGTGRTCFRENGAWTH